MSGVRLQVIQEICFNSTHYVGFPLSTECLCCIWDNGQPLCFSKEGFELLTQISYKVTFRIPTHEPATFRCDTTPPDKTITVEACHFRFKGESFDLIVTYLETYRDNIYNRLFQTGSISLVIITRHFSVSFKHSIIVFHAWIAL